MGLVQVMLGRLLTPLTLVVMILTTQQVVAQDDLAGVWEGMLEIAPGQGIEMRFNFVRDVEGQLTATVSSPAQPALQNLPVEDVSFEGGGLSLGVAALNGSFAGRLAEGVVAGSWTQPGSTVPLTLRPYVEPVLTAADMERILGSWVGTLRPDPDDDLQVTVVFRFERDAQGKFMSFMDSPDEGTMGIPVDSVGMVDDELTLSVNRARMKFIGSLEGDVLNGDWVQASRSLELNLTRGEYESAGLPLTAEQFGRLEGPWHGQIGPLNLVFRFERTSTGRFVAFFDSQDQGASNIPITQIQLDGDQLTLTAAVIGGTLTGTLAQNSIAAQWQQAGQRSPIALIRGPYVRNPDLTSEAQRYLQGIWRGNVTGADLVFSFAATSEGGFDTSLDIASVGMIDVPVSGMALEGQSLRFQINAIDARFVGALSGGQITGTWTRLDEDSQITLVRD